MSAIKMAPHMHAIALLGTNLSEAKVDEIRENNPGYEHIILALDNDATHEAIKLQLRWASRLPGMCIQSLPKDIKDMNDDEFTDWLKRTC